MSLKRVLMVISVAFGVASTADCPSYWTAYGGNCYRSFGYMTTWHIAESRCQSEKSTSGQSAHLVSIHSAAEQEYIKLLLRTGYNFFEFWSGMSDPVHFVWSDGSAYDYKHGVYAELNPGPGQHCVELHYFDLGFVDVMRWDSVPCTTQLKFLCKMPK